MITSRNGTPAKRMLEITNKIHNIGAALQGQSIETALFTAAKPMADDVKTRVRFRTGRLYTGIVRKKMKIKNFGEVAKVGITVSNRFGVKYIASRWHFEEFGFKHRKKPLKKYFHPAFEAKADITVTRFASALSKNIDKAIAGKLRLSKSWSPGNVIDEN